LNDTNIKTSKIAAFQTLSHKNSPMFYIYNKCYNLNTCIEPTK